MIPDPSGQLAELIVYITSTRVDLYSHQILFTAYDKFRRLDWMVPSLNLTSITLD